MKILCLYNNGCAVELFQWLESCGHIVVLWTEKLTEDWCAKQGFHLAVSYTYRFILPESIRTSSNRRFAFARTSSISGKGFLSSLCALLWPTAPFFQEKAGVSERPMKGAVPF